MLLLDRYLLRQILTPFFGILAVLVLGLSLERLLRLTRMIANEGAPISETFRLLSYLLPHYIGLAMSVGLFLSVLAGVRLLHERSELVIYFVGAGISIRRLLVPVLLLTAVMMAILGVLVSYAQPITRYEYRAALWTAKKTGMLKNLQPGVIHRIGVHTVLRAEEIGSDGRQLGHVFASIGDTPGSRVVITAEHGLLPSILDEGSISISLTHGQILTEMGDRPPAMANFGNYIWTLPINAAETYGARGQDARELTTKELFSGVKPIAEDKPYGSPAELHNRLAQIVALPVLATLAVPLALLGRGRAGRATGYGVGLGVFILYQQLLNLGKELSAKGSVPVWLGSWLPLLLLALFTAVMLYRTLSVRTALRKPTQRDFSYTR